MAANIEGWSSKVAHVDLSGEVVIETRNLGRTFRRRNRLGSSRKKTVIQAIQGLDLTITKGNIVGYIGVNGAGKSTTIKCLCGVLKPTTGSVVIQGTDTRAPGNKISKNVGVVFGQKTQLYWDIPPIETYKLLKAIWGIPKRIFHQTLSELLEVFQAQELIHIPVRQLSLGQRMRCDLVASLLHRPGILLLDEPTIGMDHDSSEAFRSHLKELNTANETTIFLASHDLQDIESLAKHVIVIDSGRQIYTGSMRELRNSYADYRIVSCVKGDWEAVIKDRLGDVLRASAKEAFTEIRIPTQQDLEEVLLILSNHGVLDEVSITPPTLGEVINELRISQQSTQQSRSR